MAFKRDTPSENALIWNPAYTGPDGGEMKGQLGDYLSGVCMEMNKVPSKTARGQEEYHIIIGSDGVKLAEATLKGEVLLSDEGFLFICGPSRFKLGATFVKGRWYHIALKEMKDIGQPNKYAIYERLKDDEYISPAFAEKPEEVPF